MGRRLSPPTKGAAGPVSDAALRPFVRGWSSKVIRMRSELLRGTTRWVLLVSGWFIVSQTITPGAGSTFSALYHAATLILSVDSG